jgi:hypothetical protein
MSEHKFVVCVRNDDYGASLELRKLYEVLPDEEAANHGQVRIVDESGEDYLYPQSFFAPVELTELTEQLLVKAA